MISNFNIVAPLLLSLFHDYSLAIDDDKDSSDRKQNKGTSLNYINIS